MDPSAAAGGPSPKRARLASGDGPTTPAASAAGSAAAAGAATPAMLAPVPAPALAYDGSARSIRKEIEKLEAKLQMYEAEMEEYKAQAKDETRPQKERVAARADWRVKEQQILATQSQLAAKEQQIVVKEQQILAIQSQLAAKEQQLAAERQLILVKEQQILAAKEQQLAAKEQQLAAKEQRLATAEQAAAPDPAVVAFWRALCSGQAVLDKTTDPPFLRLPDGVFLLGDPDVGSALMVRPCYVDLYEIVRGATNPAITRWVVTGNPGIGKTLFSAYVLWRLACERRTVVWEPAEPNANGNTRYLLGPDGNVLKGRQSDESFADVLRNPNTWLVADAHSPNRVVARTLLVTSPRRAVYREFIKLARTDIVYMPVWTFSEIAACKNRLYSRLAANRFEYLFALCGGIPRHVLQSAAANIDVVGQLEHAIASCNLSKCMTYVGEMDSAEDVSHRVMHLCLVEGDSTYTKTRIMFASAWVAERLAQKLMALERNDLVRFLRNSAGEGDMASLRGQLFEGYAHTVLRGGGTFRARCILPDDGVTIDVRLLRTTLQPFDDLARVDLTRPSVYYRPVSKSLAAVDALASPDLLFQMTVSAHHDVKMAGLERAVARMPAGRVPRLVFVVPPDTFRAFRAQRYVTQQGSGAQRVPVEVQAVQQWVLCIPLSSSMSFGRRGLCVLM